jgi:putative ABC transport system permease protein
MFRNYLFVALRNITRHKLHSFINIAGLTAGLTAAILIGLFVQQELSFDAWLPGSERIYRITVLVNIPGQPERDGGAASAPLGPAALEEVPDIQEQARIHSQSAAVMVSDKHYSQWTNAVDSNFFTMIRLPFMAGNPATALLRPDGVVLSQAAAIRFFGTDQAMGRTLLFDQTTPRVVTGILRDLPYNTQFSGDVFVLYPRPLPKTEATITNLDPDHWLTMDVSSYVRLAPGADPQAVAGQLTAVLRRHLSAAFLAQLGSIIPGAKDDVLKARLVPLQDVHLTPYTQGSAMKSPTSRILVFGFAAIAMLVLLVAGVNFANLATARASLRAREVALRKVMGASKRQLVMQFLIEAVLTALLALCLAFSLTELLLPAYSTFLGHRMTLDYLGNWPFVAAMVAIAGMTGLFAGIYPAFILSSFRPGRVLHSKTSASGSTGVIRTILVIFQFAVSIGLIIAAAAIFYQIRFASRLDLGFNRDNIVMVPVKYAGLSQAALENMMGEISALPGVAGVAMSDKVPGSGNSPANAVRIAAKGASIQVMQYSVSPEFAAVYGVKLEAGRFLSRDHGTDLHHGAGPEGGRNVLIDDHAARAFGFTPDGAVGKTIDLIGGRVTIVGVVHNVLFAGAQAVQVSPTIFYTDPELYSDMSVRLKAGRVRETLAAMDGIWQRHVPARPFHSRFVEESVRQFYADAERQGTLLDVFVVVAVFIASLGMFGLAAFVVERRTKEIGIRKIMGAKTGHIIRLLLWQFSVPVLLANAIAWPVAWYWLHDWLGGFAYRMSLSPLYFVGAGAAALAIAWATVFAHALRVARANPIHALRYE